MKTARGTRKSPMKEVCKASRVRSSPLSFWAVASSELQLGSQEQWADISFSLEIAASSVLVLFLFSWLSHKIKVPRPHWPEGAISHLFLS